MTIRPRRLANPLTLALWLSATLSSALLGANWPQWRGPEFDGSSPETGLPSTFTTNQNVRWITPLPGSSSATPAIWGDRVFVSSTDMETKSLVAMALERSTGKVLWQEQVGVGLARDNRSNFAAPSPVTDGKTVWFFYGNGDLAAFDLAGKKLWSRDLQQDYDQFAFLWTFSTSPMLHDGRLYMQILQRNVPVNGRGRTDGPIESWLIALDPGTGKELWRQARPSDAVAESREAFTTPIPFVHAGRHEILVAGGDCLTGHDPVDGKELWRWGAWNPNKIGHWRLVPSPVAGGGVVLACAPKGSPVYAVKAGGNGKLEDSSLAWVSQDRAVSSDVSTPLFYRNRFYVLNSDKRSIACIEPATGKVHWNGDLGSESKIEASPTGADGRIFMISHRGDVFVAAAGDEFKLLHKAPFGDPEDRDVRSSIAISQGDLFIRTGRKLYCVGGQ